MCCEYTKKEANPQRISYTHYFNNFSYLCSPISYTYEERFDCLQPRTKNAKKMNYLFSSESVSEGHPDKVADQISDAILDEFLRQDPEARVAIETFCTTGLVMVGGEVRSDHAYVDIQQTVRDVIRRIGYTKSEYNFDSEGCGVISAIHEQSADISRGVVR